MIVVGGGPAGCVLAARLSEDPARTVCLLEAGPDYGARAAGNWPAELLHPDAIPDSHDWHDDRGSLPWARVLGGCSAHNACAVTRAPAADYEWGGDWTWATLEPCLARAREAIGARGQQETGTWHAALLEAAVEAGMPRLADLDAERAGAGIAATNVSRGARHNAAFAYLDPARGRENLTVRGGALADRIAIEGGRATGVVVGDTILRAGRVVLAAGAYGSPAVLLRSGVGPEDELGRHKIKVVEALPVGQGLADHCRAGVGFALRPTTAAALRAEDGERAIVAQCIVKWASAGAEGPWDVHLLAIVPPDRATGRVTAGLVAPRSRGRVRLRSPDPAHLPVVDHGFLTEPEDLAALAEAIEWSRDLALGALITHELDPGPEVAARDHVRRAVTTYYHPTGTCRLGAVVGGDTAVHGVEGLHVADASIVPGTVRAGTHLTALAIGERAAELLAG